MQTYPDKQVSYSYPPYARNANDTATLPAGWTGQPLKFARELSSGSLKNRIANVNRIISRTYTDATSRYPAYRWIQNPNEDPEPGDPDYDDWVATYSDYRPYPSVERFIAPRYWPGTSRVPLTVYSNDAPAGLYAEKGEFFCVKLLEWNPETEMHEEVTHYVLTLKPSVYGYVQTVDWDAVDCDCDCCEEEENILPFANRQSSDPVNGGI